VSSLSAELDELARIGADGGGVSRFAWTPELEKANRWLIAKLADEGLEPELDTAGNVIGRWPAGEGRAVLVGSHLDTVPRGGRFDGALGVVAALEAVRILRRDGFEPGRPIWIVSFNDEEGARFRTSMFGSRAFVGSLDLEDWRGRGVPAAMELAGSDFGRLREACRIDDVSAYLELHVEQGPVLERSGIDLGIVTAITGLLGLRATFKGQANHAGTTPMDARRDALAGAARAVLALREGGRAGDGVTATVGQIRVEPGGANVVPGLAEISVDARSPDAARFAGLEAEVERMLREIAADERLELELFRTHSKPAVALDERVQDVLERAADAEGASRVRLPSGAGHDAMIIGAHVPAGMLFVPSRDGISHSPAEFTEPRHRELGARVLARALAELASGQDDDSLAYEEPSVTGPGDKLAGT
jgi:allantoate deiminase